MTPFTGRALRLYTKFVAAATLFLIYAGAMVTSTGSGLAVPDWPLSYGMLFPPMVGNIFYEHGHRMVAATVGFLTLLQAIFLRNHPKRLVRRLGWISLAAVIVQGILGGLTVKFFLPPAISVSHAALAEIFLCLNVSIAFFTSRYYESARDHGAVSHGPLAAGTKGLVVVVYLQILVGALMRHLQAGMAIPDFPLSFGRVIPDFGSTAIAVNFAHRAGAVVVALVVLALMVPALRSTLWRPYLMILAITAMQIALGGLTVLTGKHPVLTSLHVVNGAFLLATSLLMALAARTTAAQDPQAARSSALSASEVPA